ncbi:hypothetical protein [Maribellus sediminis]|uniref:hypothetical protein n=1 Tax=Maribellus sediminis TaxID=2696285 RepID=UPI0014319E0B|nr:hypothetical protein [Maribellus sediminis]
MNVRWVEGLVKMNEILSLHFIPLRMTMSYVLQSWWCGYFGHENLWPKYPYHQQIHQKPCHSDPSTDGEESISAFSF